MPIVCTLRVSEHEDNTTIEERFVKIEDKLYEPCVAIFERFG